MTDEQEFELLDIMLTAEEAYPCLEREFLSSENEIVAGFRIFDPWTKLRSDAADQVGPYWFDLIVHTLNRGVKIDFTLTDFDPVVRMGEHRYAWQCFRALAAAGEASDNPDLLTVRVAMHPARVGLLPRTLLWFRSVSEVNAQISRLKDAHQISDTELLHSTPKLPELAHKKGETLRAKMFPPPPLVPVTHHQKLAVFDAERVFIGGLDVNDRRFDTKEHRQRSEQTWHDVQILAKGQAADEARTHLLTIEDAVRGKKVPQPKHLLRTISAKRQIALPYLSPQRVVDEIAQAHIDAVNKSEQLIYLETQFFRDQRMADCLAARAQAQPQLTAIIVLPAAPEEIAFNGEWGPDAKFGEHLQVKCLETIQSGFGDRLLLTSPVQNRSADDEEGRAKHFGAPIIYVHAKVSIFDDTAAIVSSANLNGRSLYWDTEAGLKMTNRRNIEKLRQRCYTHWHGPAIGQDFLGMDSACETWAQRIAENASLPPEQRRGFLLPYKMEPARDEAQALPGVPSEMA
ncbi:phospholipase D-like domain-containing protein [Yoonia litorea]|uniref:Phospholipase D n=1 Tax=Yoonia litorea TaxID=1123755 RepID=A0A1I6MZV3_9RHOB|nr:phospholipase D-like domain-containing protein [Yoonia litorea]SFS21226.1 phospholipase D1/2 [Yoonia litorea]